MDSIKLDIPYVPQPQMSNMCGAACLEMIYRYFGLETSQAEIWNHISAVDSLSHRLNCHTYLMTIDAQNRGLNSVAISIASLLELIPACLKNSIVPIILCRRSPTDLYGHFCVIKGVDYKGFYLNDPDPGNVKGNNWLLKTNDFVAAARSRGEVRTSNTLILISSKNVETTSVSLKHPIEGLDSPCVINREVFTAILPYKPQILCTEHDLWSSVASYS